MTQKVDSNGYYNYRVIGLDPDQPRGHKFQSKVADLDLQPDLWPTECPYRFPDLSSVDVVKEEDAPSTPPRGNDFPLMG